MIDGIWDIRDRLPVVVPGSFNKSPLSPKVQDAMLRMPPEYQDRLYRALDTADYMYRLFGHEPFGV